MPSPYIYNLKSKIDLNIKLLSLEFKYLHLQTNFSIFADVWFNPNSNTIIRKKHTYIHLFALDPKILPNSSLVIIYALLKISMFKKVFLIKRSFHRNRPFSAILSVIKILKSRLEYLQDFKLNVGWVECDKTYKILV